MSIYWKIIVASSLDEYLKPIVDEAEETKMVRARAFPSYISGGAADVSVEYIIPINWESSTRYSVILTLETWFPVTVS